MPDYEDNPLSRLDQIKANLQDRYATGYPILKELLHNADDSEARRFRLDALARWRTAANPLLRGPDLLVVSDGRFTEVSSHCHVEQVSAIFCRNPTGLSHWNRVTRVSLRRQ